MSNLSKKIIGIIRESNKKGRIVFFAFLFKENYEMKYYIKINNEWKDNFAFHSIKESVEIFKKIKNVINEYKKNNKNALIIDSDKKQEIYEEVLEQDSTIKSIIKMEDKHLT